MTDAERARALSGATDPCDMHLGTAKNPVYGEPDPVTCAKCNGTDCVFVLGERARKTCLDATYHPSRDGMNGHPDGGATCAACDGDGWLSTLLLPDGRWDERLLRELLEEAGCVIEYQQKTWFVDNIFNLSLTGDPSLAVAACKALGVEVEQ